MNGLLDRIPLPVFRAIGFAIIIAFLITIIFPLYFMTITAFKFEKEIYSELTWFPREPTMSNFRDVVESFRIPIYVRNSAIVALSTTGIVLVISTLAAYSLTRLRYPGRSIMARGVLFVYLITGSLMFIPM
jgi:multiple sugar transport system permease protein